MGEDNFLNMFSSNNTNIQGANFSPVTPAIDASTLYSQQGSFLDSAITNGGIDPMANINATLSAPSDTGFFSNGQGGAGWGTQAIGAGVGLAQTFLGFSQLNEGKNQNRVAQQQWQAQFDIQKEEYDRRTAERAQRVADNKAAKTTIGG